MKAATRKSSPPATASWPRPANAASSSVRPTPEDRHSPRHARPSTSPPCAPPSRWPPSCTCSASSLRTSRGAQQRGPCPLHGATAGAARCFSVNLEDHTFHCFRCGRSGNALDLWPTPPARAPTTRPWICAMLGHPRAPPAVAAAPQQRRGTRRPWAGHLYNHLSHARILILLPANSIAAFFQIRLNQNITASSLRRGEPPTAEGALIGTLCGRLRFRQEGLAADVRVTVTGVLPVVPSSLPPARRRG